MIGPRQLLRLWQIHTVMRRHDLGELLGDKAWRVGLSGKARQDRNIGEGIRLALEELGPVFVKFGQALSTRPDLLPPHIATELAKLQDQVPPFSGAEAVAELERAYQKPVAEVFASFDEVPLASASIAQVHVAKLHPVGEEPEGMEVAVKILRPNVHQQIRRDIDLMFAIAKAVERLWSEGQRLHPVEIVAEYETVIFDELDMLREAANAAQLRRNWMGSTLIYHPAVFFDYCRQNVLVTERIFGIAVDDVEALKAVNVDFKALAERGVEIFFKQTFRDNFFHADMHPGNIFVDASDPANPLYIGVDFGIVGTLTESDQRYLAQNFVAFFHRDYKRVAELHIESGWVPAETRVEEFEGAIRSVCEPIFNKPLKDISFGLVLVRLFQTARRFKMEVQPQLVLLQKTLLNIEGLGRQLYPELDLWDTAKPIMDDWARRHMGPRAVVDEFIRHAPTLVDAIPDLVAMAKRRALPQQDRAAVLEVQLAELRIQHKRQLWVLAGAAALMSAALISAGSNSDQALWSELPLPGWLLSGAALVCFWRGFRSR